MSEPTEEVPEGSTGLSGPLTPVDDHKDCRLTQFSNWTRIMLEHERAFISKQLATSTAFMTQEDQEALLHDLTDIDWCLSLIDEPLRVKL